MSKRAIEPIKHHSEILYKAFTKDSKTHEALRRATKEELVDVYDALVNQERIDEIGDAVNEINLMT
eukprot:2812503-Rhodomonas_salina.1